MSSDSNVQFLNADELIEHLTTATEYPKLKDFYENLANLFWYQEISIEQLLNLIYDLFGRLESITQSLPVQAIQRIFDFELFNKKSAISIVIMGFNEPEEYLSQGDFEIYLTEIINEFINGHCSQEAFEQAIETLWYQAEKQRLNSVIFRNQVNPKTPASKILSIRSIAFVLLQVALFGIVYFNTQYSLEGSIIAVSGILTLLLGNRALVLYFWPRGMSTPSDLLFGGITLALVSALILGLLFQSLITSFVVVVIYTLGNFYILAELK